MSTESMDSASVSLVQLWLGLGTCCGSILAASSTIAKSRSVFVSKHCLLQLSQFGVGENISIVTHPYYILQSSPCLVSTL